MAPVEAHPHDTIVASSLEIRVEEKTSGTEARRYTETLRLLLRYGWASVPDVPTEASKTGREGTPASDGSRGLMLRKLVGRGHPLLKTAEG